MSRVHDVLVVGAGPAGASTAARLHQHGVKDVVVLERYDFPRDKPCGGGLTGYSDALYTTQLSASATATGSTRCSLLAACERQLLEQAVAVPLFTQQKRLLVANGIEGLVFDPFGPVLDVTYATKS